MPSRVLQHRQRVQRDVRRLQASGARRQVVGVGFAGHLNTVTVSDSGTSGLAGEPFGIGPALHGPGVGVAGLGLLLHVVEGVEHQQGVLSALAATVPTSASSSSSISGWML